MAKKKRNSNGVVSLKNPRPSVTLRSTAGIVNIVIRNGHQNGTGRPIAWKEHLSSYRDLRELRFSTRKQNHKALKLLDTDNLRDMPYDLTGGGIVVPAEAVQYFETIGNFTAKKLDLY